MAYEGVFITLENAGPASATYAADRRTDWRYISPHPVFTIEVARSGPPFVVKIHDRRNNVATFFIEEQDKPTPPAQVAPQHRLELAHATVSLHYYSYNRPGNPSHSGRACCGKQHNKTPPVLSNQPLADSRSEKPAKGPPGLLFLAFLALAPLLVIAYVFEFYGWVRSRPMRALLWLLTVVALVVPPLWMYMKPDDYKPAVQILLSSILFGLTFWLGYDRALKKAIAMANDRWLPQAESAMNRLLTVFSSVRRLRSELSEACNAAEQQLTELGSEKNKAIKTFFGTQCHHNASRLGDIVNHLEDALDDWARFVEANCQDLECQRINEAIVERRLQLDAQTRSQCGNTTCIFREMPLPPATSDLSDPDSDAEGSMPSPAPATPLTADADPPIS